MATKINQLLKNLPPGTVVLQSWLETQGVGRKLSHRYVAAGWLERFGYGAYIRAGDTTTWRGAVYALQHHASARIWPGGATALQLQGFGQYLPLARETIWLWSAPGTHLPAWFRSHDWGVATRLRAVRLFPDEFGGFESDARDGFGIQMSSLERASFELAHEVTDAASFSWAAEHLQSLVSLRPGVMQQHLEVCQSVRAKRVLLFLGKYYRHAWVARINLSRVDLGSGKRQVVKGGRLDADFHITVPAEFADG